jgi:membrane-associated phospholipid phosphatase
LAVAGVVVVAAFGLVFASSSTVVGSELRIDEAISRSHVTVLTAVALRIDWLFSPVRAVIVGVMIALAILWRTRRIAPPIFFTLVVGLGWLAGAVLKVVVHRARPDQARLAHPHLPLPSDFSYPSGHTMFVALLAFALILLARGTPWFRFAVVAGVAAAVVVALSRVYLGVHYPTDVTASLILAPSVALLIQAGCAAALLHRARSRPIVHSAGSQDPRPEEDR